VKEVTRILEQLGQGDSQASQELFSRLHTELRGLADRQLARERVGHTLQPTALVHEAYLRLVDADIDWAGRNHFFRVAGRTMRRILVDLARGRGTDKRGGGWRLLGVEDAVEAVESDPDAVLDLEQALATLEQTYPVHAELVSLRFYGQKTQREAAELLGLPPTTADRHWVFARTWLRSQLSAGT
jgi:RNA polymerase sigma factor (TIGR02999 family)